MENGDLKNAKWAVLREVGLSGTRNPGSPDSSQASRPPGPKQEQGQGAGVRSEHLLCVTELCQGLSRRRVRTYLASEKAPNSHSQSQLTPSSSLFKRFWTADLEDTHLGVFILLHTVGCCIPQ